MNHPDLLYRLSHERLADQHRGAALGRELSVARGSLRGNVARLLSLLASRLEPELRNEPQHALRG